MNSITTGRQLWPSVAASANGEFVVTWWIDSPGGYSIQARRFSRSGAPLAAEIRIDEERGARPREPVVAYSPSGTFLVAWDSPGVGIPRTLRARLLSSQGTPLGSEAQVNSYVANISRQDLSVAGLSDGSFVVAWTSRGSPGTDLDGDSVQARRLSALGEALASDFQVNSLTEYSQRQPAVAPFSDGTFVVAWAGARGQDPSVELRHMAPSASNGVQPVGTESSVYQSTSAGVEWPALAWVGGERAMVAWKQRVSFSGEAVVGKQTTLATSGSDPLLVLSETPPFEKGAPAIATGPSGEFVAVWREGYFFGPDGSWSALLGRTFDSTGAPKQNESVVNTYTTGLQASPSVAAFQDGGFVVAWNSEGSFGTDQSGDSIQARVFGPIDPTRIFTDGFETGDPTRWSTDSGSLLGGLE